ncbi:MAG: hypothetical protein KatS3mg129_1435 [Leptospiraceae bacterium]|nr:MAG: hypothetical protein KatS3mg129_1435 [Leptospiraceae bacterium]
MDIPRQELEEVFKDYLEGEDLEIIKEWYNGYSWLGESVYNPFDVLLYLREKMLHPYWFETGTPTFLIKLLIEKKFYIPQLEDLCASDHLIGSFDVDFIEPENLLFQTGYLTIKSYKQMLKGIVYNLSYPNKEVKISLNDYLGRYLTNLSSEKERLTQKLEEILGNGEIIEFKEILQSLFSSIPYEWYKKNEISGYEGYYASVVYSFLAGAGFNIIAEDYTSEGRIDLTIQYKEKCYIIEFKVIEIERKNQRGALEQLEIKNYADKYKSRYNTIYLVGIEFIKEKKNIIDFLWKEIKN